jgi:hypothetical protein
MKMGEENSEYPPQKSVLWIFGEFTLPARITSASPLSTWASCPAIEAVAAYLRNGGIRAPDPLPPCPICGAETFRDREWDSKYNKEPGWRCTAGGISHFLQAKVQRIQEALRRKPSIARACLLGAIVT